MISEGDYSLCLLGSNDWDLLVGAHGEARDYAFGVTCHGTCNPGDALNSPALRRNPLLIR